MADDVPDPGKTDPEELARLLQQALEENAELKREIAALRDENARLKGHPPRPRSTSSGMAERATSRGKEQKQGNGKPVRKKGKRGGKRDRLTIDEDRILRPNVPGGARFKGYQDFLVQDVIVRARTIRYRRERWQTSDGEVVVAELPDHVQGHYGPELRRLVLSLYHRGQMTVPRLTAQLQDVGLAIEDRQVRRLLTVGNEGFEQEARDILRAGLATAPWISVDDTGARHGGRNEICTQIGDDRFTAFATTGSKSRRNFLALLRAGHKDYVINDAALAYMRQRKLSETVIAQLRTGQWYFADAAAWQSHLAALGLEQLKIQPDPVRVATEGALWGAIQHHGLMASTVVLSDEAGQFRLQRHALCWVHAERRIHALDTFTEHQRHLVQRMRQLIWWFYADLKDYAQNPTPQRKGQLKQRFDRIFQRQTGFATLDRLLARLHARKDELLAVLEHPKVPLHTNGSENDIRSHVTRRKISGGTCSEAGRAARDTFLGLLKSCDKLDVSFWQYLGDRLGAAIPEPVPPLGDLVRKQAPG